MARKSTSKAAQPDAEGVIERMEFSLSTPPGGGEPRPGSAVSLEMVNVFGEPVADGARLRLTAWVNNLAYVKHVWADAYLRDAKGAVVSSDTLVLDYYEGAGGGGDFFILDAPIRSEATGRKAAVGLQYRLYYQIGDSVYTDGILHEHSLTPAGKAPAGKAPAKPAAKAAPRIGVAAAAAPGAAAPAAKVAKTAVPRAVAKVAKPAEAAGTASATTKAAPRKPAATSSDAPVERTTRSRRA